MNPGGLHTPHYPEQKSLLDLEKFVPIPGQYVSEDLDLKKGCAEIKKAHVNRGRIDKPSFPEQAADAFEDGGHLLRGCPVAQTQDWVEPEPVTCRKILKAQVRNLPIGDAYHSSV